MNRKRVTEILAKVKTESLRGSKEHACVYHKVNTKEHELAKFKVFMYLVDNDCKVYTEVKFKRGRTDILAIKNDQAYCIEILHTETKEKLKKKCYPFEIIALRSGDVLNSESWKDELYFL